MIPVFISTHFWQREGERFKQTEHCQLCHMLCWVIRCGKIFNVGSTQCGYISD